jgi:tetratricopeptide (TPR) repeat protein
VIYFMEQDSDCNSRYLPERDVEIAKWAMQRGDLAHAASHLSSALSSNPQNLLWLSLFDGIIERSTQPLELLPLEDNMYFGAVAGRAYILASLGNFDRAVDLLSQVLEFESGYLPWLDNWLSVPEQVATLDPNTILSMFSRFLGVYPGNTIAKDPTARYCLDRLWPILDNLYRQDPTDTALGFLSSSVLRKLERFDEALAVANTIYAAEPSWQTAISKALVYRAMGEIDEAVAAYLRASELDVTDVSALLDIADILCENDRAQTGVNYYLRALERQPQQPWARCHYFYHKFFLTQDFIWQERLQAYAEQNPDNQTAVRLASELEELLAPYVGYLPTPSEAIINGLQQIDSSATDGLGSGEIKIAVSSLEAPSSRLAVELYLLEKSDGCKLTISVAEIPAPDPRFPRQPVDYLLWQYNGTEPTRAVSPPAIEIARSIGEMASYRYNLNDWWLLAREIGSQLSQEHAKDLLGTMLYPPPHPDGVKIWNWLYRVQVAAALVLAHLHPNGNSVLFALARGPMDWTVGAAIIALTQIALTDASAAPGILELFIELLQSIPQPGYCPYEHTLVLCCLRLPFINSDLRSYLERYRQAIESDEEVDA